MVLLVFENEQRMEYVMAKQIETLDNWFLRLQRWSEKIIIDSRRAWLACRRIPIHAWNMVTFQNIGERWGDFISVDSGTLYPSYFMRANIQIVTDIS
ncbi:hypothetical protein J1N35_041511 [Gossypium stocksii]|uniref:DUF4283 domain-containing protein n=1 Tax=Gossypium stocksii TaxID=47602 RepID=A0A9D3UG47_9ROSI|nr:hypothetical protein J1N35_041511 [Gossypium stocksii]